MKKNFKSFIKEIIPVIVGILIALFINNWNEGRKEKKYIEKIFLSVNKELAETDADIANILSLQKSYIDTLDFYFNNDKISLKDIILKSNGINIPTIKLHSWKAISNSKIELVDYDKLSALANIEEQNETLSKKTERMGDFLYANINETGKDKKEIMKMLFMDIMGTEIAIQNGIEKFNK